jgi:3',5'-cyclic AMP phosphodiesterase CpdA
VKLAVTADLHWGIREPGDAATRRMLTDLQNQPPDLLILAGDVGAGDDFERCLELFAGVPSRKALVPGNHDVWVTGADARGDSWQVYNEFLPRLCSRYDFHFLDHGPLILPEAGVAVVGTMNWYDYSWAIDDLPKFADDWQERLESMRFTRGYHNDRRFVRWQYTDAGFTNHCVAAFERHLDEAMRVVEKVIVVTHHPACRELNFPSEQPPHLDQVLWRAFSGNKSMEQVLERNAARIARVFSAHTHKTVDTSYKSIPAHNIGGDYGWKRLLLLDWPSGSVESREYR